MISWVLTKALRVFASRFGPLAFAAVIAAGVFGWHVIDKRNAVAAARTGLVSAFELRAVQAELNALRLKARAVDEANQALREKVQAVKGEAEMFASELRRYENETDVNPDCVVDDNLLRLLRAK